MIINEFYVLLEHAINQAIKLDTHYTSKIKKLDKKIIKIELSNIHQHAFIEFHVDRIKIVAAHQHYDATISAPIQAMACWLISKDTQQAKSLGLTFDGDSETLQSFQMILDELQIDWEEHLAQITNDEIAHEISRFILARKNHVKKLSDDLGQSFKEYLEEEAELIPTASQVSTFLADVDETRHATDRLAAKIHLLEKLNESN